MVISIRYASIRSIDISNGEGVGIALFVQGCHLHCPNCFNPETWDFDGGKKWTEAVKNKFLELANRPYIERISILGGEPLAKENLDGVLDLVNKIRLSKPKKSIWLYSGYTWDSIFDYKLQTDVLDDNKTFYTHAKIDLNWLKRKNIIKQCDIFIDGEYIDSQQDISLKWKGSKNQNVIDVQKSLSQNEIILYQY